MGGTPSSIGNGPQKKKQKQQTSKESTKFGRDRLYNTLHTTMRIYFFQKQKNFKDLLSKTLSSKLQNVFLILMSFKRSFKHRRFPIILQQFVKVFQKLFQTWNIFKKFSRHRRPSTSRVERTDFQQFFRPQQDPQQVLKTKKKIKSVMKHLISGRNCESNAF